MLIPSDGQADEALGKKAEKVSMKASSDVPDPMRPEVYVGFYVAPVPSSILSSVLPLSTYTSVSLQSP